MKQLLKYLAMLITLGLALAACSGSSRDSAGSNEGASGAEVSAEVASDDGDASTDAGGLASPDEAEPTAAQSSAGLSVGPETVNPSAKIIFEADVTAEAEDVAFAVNKASDEARKAGGFVADQQVSLGETGQATMTLRVPAAQFDDVLEAIRGIANPLSVNVSTDDVSLDYIDLVARIRTQEASLARVIGLLDSATNTDEILRLEGVIAQRQGEVDSLKGRLNFLDNRVDLSTIRLRIVEIGKAPVELVDAEDDSPGFSDGLQGGVDAFLAVARVLMVAAGALLPFLPVLLIGGIIFTLWRRRQEARRAQARSYAPGVGLGANLVTQQPAAPQTEEAPKEPVGSGTQK